MSRAILIGFPQSSFVWTARAALEHKGVPHEFQPIAPPQSKTPEHLARHPWGKVPVFEHEDLTLYETTAICSYVDAAFEGPALYPSEAKARARAIQLTSIANNYFYPAAVARYALQYIFPRGPEGAPDRETIDAAVPDIETTMGVLEALLGESKWFLGDELTVADLYVGPLVALCGMFPESKAVLGASPQLARLVGQLMQVPAFAKSAPPQG